MKTIKTFEQFNSTDAEMVEESFLFTDKYDLFKDYTGNKLISKLAEHEYYLKEFSSILTNAGVTPDVVKTLEKNLDKGTRMKFLSLDMDAVKKCQELMSQGKAAKKEINDIKLYKINPLFSKVKAEGWKAAAEKLQNWLSDPKTKNLMPKVTGVENGEIVFGGMKSKNPFAGGGTDSFSGSGTGA